MDLLQRSKKGPNSLEELIVQREFLESVTSSVNKSPGELLLMALKFSLVNKLSFTSTSNLLQLINRIFEERIIPETRYMIDKLCNPKNSVSLHCVCPACTKYLGKFEEMEKFVNCENCGTKVDVSNPSNPCYFAIIDPSDAVRNYLQTHEEYYESVIKGRRHEKNHIKDIYDGKAYRLFVRNLPGSDRFAYVSVAFNTDGAPVFESSDCNMWPIYIVLNEIPVQERLDSPIEVGIWVGMSKPEMSVFLEAFVDHMNMHAESGILCTIKGEDRHIKMFSLVSPVDNIARAPMNGTKQFNGHNGCDWCEQFGEHHAGSMRYPYEDPPAPERTHASTIEYAKQAVSSGKPVCGVKSASPLLNLKGFDIIVGFTPEYMHAILIGVAKQFTEYLLQLLSEDQIDLLNKLMALIKAPHQLVRLARMLKWRGDWKAREWENWLLYYSLPLLSIVLKDKKLLKHWGLLVKAVYLSLKTDITYSELNDINELLTRFVAEAEEHYTLTAMTYNVHQLLHIPKCIEDWGPLWAHSTFAFESANYRLLTAIQSAKGVIQQIVRYRNLQRSVQILEKVVYPESCRTVEKYCRNLTGPQVKKVFKSSSITYFGKGKVIDNFLIEKFEVSVTTKSFSKLVKEGCLYTSSAKNNARSCNYFAQLKDGKFVKIINFLVDVERNNELTVCKMIKTKSNAYADVIHDILEVSDDITAVPTNEIAKVCIYIESNKKACIIPVVNPYFY